MMLGIDCALSSSHGICYLLRAAQQDCPWPLLVPVKEMDGPSQRCCDGDGYNSQQVGKGLAAGLGRDPFLLNRLSTPEIIISHIWYCPSLICLQQSRNVSPQSYLEHGAGGHYMGIW